MSQQTRKPETSIFADNRSDVFFDASALKSLSNPKDWKFYSPFQPLSSDASGEAQAFQVWAHKHQHAHPFYEIMLVVQGSSRFWVNNSVVLCERGTMVIIAPNQAHTRSYCPDDCDIKHLWISFITPEQAFIQFVTASAGKTRWLHGERSLVRTEKLSSLLQTLKTIASEKHPFQNTQISLLLTAVFAESLNLALTSLRQPANLIDRGALLREKIAIARRHIQEVHGNTTIADLAQITGYTPSHFARVFKRITGQTVHQHIDICRLDKARVMLAANASLKEIALELGFANKNTLSRWLNKYRHLF